MNQLYEIWICTKQGLIDELLKEYIIKKMEEIFLTSKIDMNKIKIHHINSLNEINKKSNMLLVTDKKIFEGKITNDLKSNLLGIIKFYGEKNSIQMSILSLKDIDDMLQKFLKKNNDSPELVSNHLTKRETEILILIAKGLLNKEIADKLNITERTVKNHISNIFKKINVYDRTQAAVYAIKHKIYVV